MAQFLEFISTHWMLSTLWVLLLVALIVYQRSKSGQSLGVHQATQQINREDAVVLDVREQKEFDKGHIVDAINIPMAKLKDRVRELEKHREQPVIVVCNMGNQSGEAVSLLTREGFTHVSRLRGGITEWRTQGLPLVTKK